MLTPKTSISNLPQTLAVPGGQDTQSTQPASVEGVTARYQGPIELQQMPGHYPTTPEAAPTPFTPSAKLMERADKLREAMALKYGEDVNKLGTVWSDAKFVSMFGLVQGSGSLAGNSPAVHSVFYRRRQYSRCFNWGRRADGKC